MIYIEFYSRYRSWFCLNRILPPMYCLGSRLIIPECELSQIWNCDFTWTISKCRRHDFQAVLHLKPAKIPFASVEMRFFCLLLILLFSCLQFVTSLDVSWIPTDPDGPLPLSAKYRNSLRKLCVLIDNGATLPSAVLAKKPTLVKMCKKLRSGDSNIASALNFTTLTNFNKVLITGIIGIGGTLLIWDRRRQIGKYIRKLLKTINGGQRKEVLQNLIDVQVAREARLKRFNLAEDLDSIVNLAEVN